MATHGRWSIRQELYSTLGEQTKEVIQWALEKHFTELEKNKLRG
jgi:hypothetical protein